jgi:hypothetical protein
MPMTTPMTTPMPIPLSPMRVHHLPMALAFGATDIGPVREGNEDNFLLDGTLGLAMVADGMGGHAAGEVASAGVLTEVHAYLAAHAPALAKGSDSDQTIADPDATWSAPRCSTRTPACTHKTARAAGRKVAAWAPR